MDEIEQGKAALAWMRAQAKQIAPGIVGENESVGICSRVISVRIEDLQGFVKRVVSDNQGNVFMLEQGKKLLK